jgi:putative isomerase
MLKKCLFFGLICCSLYACEKHTSLLEADPALYLFDNVLDYNITPESAFDKSGLMFSDQGAWFAYGLSDTLNQLGFSGPFLLTQENGVWLSDGLLTLEITGQQWKQHTSHAYASHLEQVFTSDQLSVSQQLVYASPHKALVKTVVENTSDHALILDYFWKVNEIWAEEMELTKTENQLIIQSGLSDAKAYTLYDDKREQLRLLPGASIVLEYSQLFIFPEYQSLGDNFLLGRSDFDTVLDARKKEKVEQYEDLFSGLKPQFKDSIYQQLVCKALLTLQNNWRVPAGSIKHAGLFPSYHYKWFNGFWSWDSWKHAVGLSYYDLELAKEQVRLMFVFQDEDGFVPDVVYRDTTIEKHNYRDTKPPLSTWAVHKIFEQSADLDFVKEMYPKLKKYHNWWYTDRDHDQDGICEYGSTDGSLIAAKWESGMDNAVRFDDAEILQNGPTAFSLNQESVDLNAYLYLEKILLSELAASLGLEIDADDFSNQASILKEKINNQFYDATDGWYYDTDISGTSMIRVKSCEGWIPLWTKVANQDQANAVQTTMLDTNHFLTKVPLQALSVSHPEFNPQKGYWRGPNWLDQAYFGIQGLRNYGFEKEADQLTLTILEGAEGLLDKGTSIRENYHPVTGEGLNAHNFSWSAAHIIMLLVKE